MLTTKKQNTRSSSHAGFTLVELMIVIGILGVIGAIAWPNFMSWKINSTFRGSVTRLRSEIFRAKMLAFETGHETMFELCGDVNNSFQIIEGDLSNNASFVLPVTNAPCPCPMSVANQAEYTGASRKAFVGNLDDDFPGVTLADVTIGGDTQVIFTPRGVSDTADDVGGQDDATYQITDGTNTQNIVINPVGRIVLQ